MSLNTIVAMTKLVTTPSSALIQATSTTEPDWVITTIRVTIIENNETQSKVKKVDMKSGRQIYENDLGKITKTVPYKRNTFVMFANNSPNNVHGVSLRENATKYRRSVNIIGEFKRGYAKMYNVEEVR